MAFEGPFDIYNVLPLIGIDVDQAKKSGRSSIAVPCPNCMSDYESLFINLETEIFHCFRCDVSGALLDLYSIYDGRQTKNKEERKKSYQAICDKLMIVEDMAGSVSKPRPPKPKPAKFFEPTRIEVRDKTYRTLLSFCSLSGKHMSKLLKRGITQDYIAKCGYRSAPQVLNDDIVSAIMERGNIVKGVPGFYLDADRNWRMVAPRKGILLPMMDIMHRVQGLQIRLDNPIKHDNKKTRFNWFSSASVKGECVGCGANIWYHFVGDRNCDTLILTEGPMKADIIHHFTGISVLAVPGVNNLKYAFEALASLKKINLQRVIIAYDMDLFSNWQVDKGYKKLTAFLEQNAIWYNHLLWNPMYKGLDDFLFHVRSDEGIDSLNHLIYQLNNTAIADERSNV